jgi:small neutral amino acid transporter SnatA (MarC family)
MNDHELKLLWQRQELAAPVKADDAELVSRMKKKMRQFDRNIFCRDIREFAASIWLVWIFCGKLRLSTTPLSIAGCWVVIVSAFFIAGELFYTRFKFRMRKETLSLREHLQAEVRKVGWQARMLETVLWWYILPVMIGAELFALGETRDLTDRIVITLTLVFVSAVLWWVNRYAAKRSLRPLQKELEGTLEATPEFLSSFGGTTDHRKP